MLSDHDLATKQTTFYEIDAVKQTNEANMQLEIRATQGLAQLTRMKFMFECATSVEYLIWMNELQKACSQS